MPRRKKETGGFTEKIELYHPPGCGHTRPGDEDEAEGPSKVATPAYRTGWDQIFGKKNERGQA